MTNVLRTLGNPDYTIAADGAVSSSTAAGTVPNVFCCYCG